MAFSLNGKQFVGILYIEDTTELRHISAFKTMLQLKCTI